MHLLETLRPPTPWELKNPGVFEDLPVFDDPGEAVSFLDEQETAALKEMEAAAHEAMQLDQKDPTQQMYFRREDRKTVVHSEAEHAQCQLKGVQMTVIPYEVAVQALKEQEAHGRQAKKARAKKKTARQSRKRNR